MLAQALSEPSAMDYELCAAGKTHSILSRVKHTNGIGGISGTPLETQREQVHALGEVDQRLNDAERSDTPVFWDCHAAGCTQQRS